MRTKLSLAHCRQILTSKLFPLIAVPILAMPFNNCGGAFRSVGASFEDLQSLALNSTGGQLYTKACADCHGGLLTSTKKLRTADEIQAAIDQEPSMRSLAYLSPAEIQLIAQALSMNTTPGSPASRPSSYQLLVGNRFHLQSHLEELFVADSNRNADDTAILSTIDGLVTRQIATFGGGCTRYDGNCLEKICGGDDECRGRLGTAMAAPITPSLTAVSKSFAVRSCEEILSRDRALQTLLTKSGLNPAVEPSQANMTQVARFINRDRPLSSDSLNSLMGIVRAAQTNSMNSLDQWRFALLPLCYSSWGDLL